MTRPIPVYLVPEPPRPSWKRALLGLVARLCVVVALMALLFAAIAHQWWGVVVVDGLVLLGIARDA